MKKFLIALGLIGIVGFGGLMATKISSNPVLTFAEEEVAEPEDLSATVVIGKLEHGTVEASILEGVEGDICKLNVNPDVLYVIGSVSVNDTALIEDENISGLYSFALVRGINTVTVKFAVNQELLGDLSIIFEQAQNKDWTRLFSVENIITLVKWVLDCGILIAIIRYYIKDKRLEKKIEEVVENILSKVLPNTLKEAVVEAIMKAVQPLFAQLQAQNVDLTNAMSVFAKCMALAQENTPESRTAILNELSKLNISDEATLNSVKAFIEKLFAENLQSYNEALAKIKEIGEANKAIMEEKPVEEKSNVGDGTAI